MVRSIQATGKVITITKVFKGLGTFDGEICDLYQYKENGVKHLIEAPRIADH